MSKQRVTSSRAYTIDVYNLQAQSVWLVGENK